MRASVGDPRQYPWQRDFVLVGLVSFVLCSGVPQMQVHLDSATNEFVCCASPIMFWSAAEMTQPIE